MLYQWGGGEVMAMFFGACMVGRDVTCLHCVVLVSGGVSGERQKEIVLAACSGKELFLSPLLLLFETKNTFNSLVASVFNPSLSLSLPLSLPLSQEHIQQPSG